MLKKLTVFVILLSFILIAVPVSAAHNNPHQENYSVSESTEPVIYKETITVTEDGGVFRVGFADVVFKKDFLDPEMLPITFDVEISAVDGVAGIEFQPGVPDFCKDVFIRVDEYNGLLYDKTQEKNIYVEIDKQLLKVSHFSRYAFS